MLNHIVIVHTRTLPVKNFMPYGIIYLATNTVNGKRYVGQTVNPHKRWRDHKSAARRNIDKAFYAAMRKYGEDAFVFETLATGGDKVSLTAGENFFIKMYESLDREKGYNRCEAGPCGRFTEESRKKMSAWQTGRKLTPEHRANLSKGLKGKIVFSPETRQRISQRMKGKKTALGTHWSEESKAAVRGIKKSPEVVEALRQRGIARAPELSKKMLGEGNPFFGKKHSEETLAKMRAYKRTPEHCRKISLSKMGEKASRYRHDVSTPDLVAAYQGGIGTWTLSKMFGMDKAAIWHRLKKEGVLRSQIVRG
jgi:group I intron endonuclease